MKNTIPGFMITYECQQLREIFSKYNYQGSIGIEIGSAFGRSAWEISNSISNGHLYCIDIWDGWSINEAKPYWLESETKPKLGQRCTLESFLEYTKECKNITAIKGSSPQCVSEWSIPIDFVFLDGLHANPQDRESIDFWLPKIKSGGTIAGHDYYPNSKTRYPDVLENVKYLEQLLNKKVCFDNRKSHSSVWYFTL